MAFEALFEQAVVNKNEIRNNWLMIRRIIEDKWRKICGGLFKNHVMASKKLSFENFRIVGAGLLVFRVELSEGVNKLRNCC